MAEVTGNVNSEAKIAERNERAKKLYRYITDVARRIDDSTLASHNIADLFTTQQEIQRHKLRENCEKLLFLEPLEYGKRCIELLWRKAYYDTISAAKKLRENNNEQDSYLFTHIVCGIGHFHHLIARIQSEWHVQCNEVDLPLLVDDEETEEENQSVTDDLLAFGKSALHLCVMYLGDLSRYKAEIFHTFDESIAARYYLQAAHIDTSSGMPHNQLGNLYMEKNYNLDSVCYYIHCLSCVTPFEGAMGNLTKIFEKNEQFCETMIQSDSLTQSEHIQNMVANFISLIEMWYVGKKDDGVPQTCNTVAHQLKLALEFEQCPLPDINKNYVEYMQAVEEENMSPTHLSGHLIHKMVQTCLFTLTKVIEIDEQKAFACKAFTLAVLSQLLQKFLNQLESFGFANPASKYQPRKKIEPSSADNHINEEEHKFKEGKEKDLIPTPEPVIDNGIKHNDVKIMPKDKEVNEDHTSNNDSKNNTKKSSTKRRRRRRIASSESSDLSEVETQSSDVESVDESVSDEELSDSSYDDNECSKSEDSCSDSDEEKQVNGNVNGHIEVEDKKINSGDIKIDKAEKSKPENTQHFDNKENKSKELNIQKIQQFLLGNNFLPSIKLLQDWVLTEKELIISCGDSGESLFQCVVNLLNILSYYFNPKNNENNSKCQLLEYAKNVANKFKLEYKTLPLPEDVSLRGTTICKFDKDAAEWNVLDKFRPTVYEENIIRILNFIDFGHQIAKIVPKIRFNRSMKIYYLKKNPTPRIGVKPKLNHKKVREWYSNKKEHEGETGLLRRLGKLWLTSKVRELERSGRAPTPALLAVDAAALHLHLRRVKQLLKTRNFILLLPTVVVQELDELKRERSTARDAIRWLEHQLRSGSRFLRAQKPNQTKPLPLLKYPKKAPPQLNNFIQILEFCHHFIAADKQGGNGDPDNTTTKNPLLILLVGNELASEEMQCKEFSLTGAAQSAGITVEFIGNFYAKWRQTSKSGKKR